MGSDLLIIILFFVLGPILRAAFSDKKRQKPLEQKRYRRPKVIPNIEWDELHGENYNAAKPNMSLKQSIVEEPTHDSRIINREDTDKILLRRTRKKSSFVINKNNMLYGVIMKEVLGPPKALSKKNI
ncbi:MAG: hypothetical protein GX759_05170 [Thermoanaerobacterales bacterium]|jgi:hypothetical protein|nr:hypothetical protein [Thermoanaerobacterales bacterium]